MTELFTYMPKRNPQESIAVLQKTKEIIETKGWGQRSFYQFDKTDGRMCNFCLTGAFIEAYTTLEINGAPIYRAHKALANVIEQLYGRYNIPIWNDEKGRSKTDVLKVIELAIAEIGDELQT